MSHDGPSDALLEGCSLALFVGVVVTSVALANLGVPWVVVLLVPLGIVGRFLMMASGLTLGLLFAHIRHGDRFLAGSVAAAIGLCDVGHSLAHHGSVPIVTGGFSLAFGLRDMIRSTRTTSGPLDRNVGTERRCF